MFSTGERSRRKRLFTRDTANRQISSWGQDLLQIDGSRIENAPDHTPHRGISRDSVFSRPRIFEKLSVHGDMQGELPIPFEELPISFEELPVVADVFEGLAVSFEELSVATDVVNSWFADLSQEAEDIGEPTPSGSVIEEAKRIVLSLRSQLPEDTDVYLMDGGKIAIEVYGDLGYAFLLVCEPGGSALCVVTVNGVSRRARYESSSILPDCFVCEGLTDVQQVAQGDHGFPAPYRRF